MLSKIEHFIKSNFTFCEEESTPDQLDQKLVAPYANPQQIQAKFWAHTEAAQLKRAA